MTWFDRIKACQTPEEMADLLNSEGSIFCPSCDCPGPIDASLCPGCIAAWLRGEA